MTPHRFRRAVCPQAARLSSRVCCAAGLFWLVVSLFGAVWVPSALADRVYGYEDPLGMLHLSPRKVNDKYKLLWEGETKPDHAALVRLLREREAVIAPEGPLDGFTNLPSVATGLPSSLTPGKWAARPYPHPSAKRYLPLIERAASRYTLDPLLVYSVMELESGFRARAVSPKGAQGLMQIMPATQRDLGLADAFDPAANAQAGARYLRWMMTRFQSVPLALAAYNAGPGAVAKYGGVPPYAETRRYVALIMARYNRLLLQDKQDRAAQALADAAAGDPGPPRTKPPYSEP